MLTYFNQTVNYLLQHKRFQNQWGSNMNRFIVTAKATRPAGDDEHCFYCGRPIGAEHKSNCVLVYKKVKVKLVVEYEIEVPSRWNKSDIEFHRNDGSWCASNLIQELETLDESEGCLCNIATYECGEDTSGPYLNEE